MQWERTKYRLKMCVYIKESLNCTEIEMNKKKVSNWKQIEREIQNRK